MSVSIPKPPRHRPKPSKAQLARIRLEVFTRDKWTCQYCGVHIPPRTPDEESGRYAPSLPQGLLDWHWLELDHITPYAAGGGFTVANLRAACSPCNRRKGKSTKEAEWAARVRLARSILESRPPTESTARAAIKALSGE